MEHLPPWLRNLPLPPRPASGDTPDWLRDVAPSAPPAPSTPPPPAKTASEPADDTPDWLRELQSEIGAAPTGDTYLPGVSPRRESGDTPDWLRDVAAAEPATPARPAPFGATGWLHSLSSSSENEDVPESEPKPEPPPTTTTSRIKMPVGATDWLRSIGQEADPAEPKTPRSSVSEMIDVKSGVPDWLRDVTPAEIQSVSSAEPVADDSPPPSQKVFDPLSSNWLTDEPVVTSDDRTVLADWASDASARAETVAADHVPDWLRDVAPVSFDAPSDQGGARDPGSVPDWLSGSGRDDSSAPQADTGVPDWLRDVSGGDDSSDDAAPSWLGGSAAAVEPAADADEPDWLRASDAAAPPTSPIRGAQEVVPDPADEDVPDWLRDVEARPAPAPADDVPAWLRDEVQERPAPAPADDVPAWLRDEVQERPEPAPADDVPAWLRDEVQERPEPAPADDVPAWLRETATTPGKAAAPPPAPPAPVAAPPPADDVPAWLRDEATAPRKAAAPPPAPPAPVAAPPPADDVPAWLRDAVVTPAPPAAAVPPAAPVPVAAPPPADDVPVWLRDAVVTPAPAAPPPAPAPVAAPAPADDVPAWLREAAGPTVAPAQIPSQDLPPWLSVDSSEPTTVSGPSTAGDMSLPSWLRGVADDPLLAQTPAPSPKADDDVPSPPRRRAASNEDAEGDDFFKGAELPGWLRPPEAELPTASPEGQALDWLTRLGAADEGENETGISSDLPVVVTAAPARRLYQRSPEQMDAATLIGQLVRVPYPTPIASPAPVPLPLWRRIGLDRVLYVLFAMVLLAGLLYPQYIAPIQTAAPTAPGVTDLSQRLASLGPDDVVMIAYEWDAQRSAELRPLEQAVTSQLMSRKTKLILLSTDLQGTLLSFDLRGQLRAAGYNIDPDGRVFGGRDYVFLGYRPGGEMALRLLSQNLRAEFGSDFEGRDATQGLLATNMDGSPRVSQISDLAMIIVLADQPQDAQIWMEQVHSTAPSVPITFLMPQETEPIVQPYLRLPNVYHLAGLQGALALNTLAGADGVAIAQAIGQQSLAVLAFVILLIVGGLGLALAHVLRTRRGAA